MTRTDWTEAVLVALFVFALFAAFVKPFAFAIRFMVWCDKGVWISAPGLLF